MKKKIIIGTIAVLSIILAYQNYTSAEYYTLYGKTNGEIPIGENHPIVFNDAQVGFVTRFFNVKDKMFVEMKMNKIYSLPPAAFISIRYKNRTRESKIMEVKTDTTGAYYISNDTIQIIDHLISSDNPNPSREQKAFVDSLINVIRKNAAKKAAEDSMKKELIIRY